MFKPKKYIFKYNNRGYDNELILPVTPSHFTITSGIKTEVVNLTEVGDLNIPGTESSETITLDVMFPIQKYPFVTGPHNSNPYVFTDAFERWARSHLPVRFVVSDTSVNIRNRSSTAPAKGTVQGTYTPRLPCAHGENLGFRRSAQLHHPPAATTPAPGIRPRKIPRLIKWSREIRCGGFARNFIINRLYVTSWLLTTGSKTRM